MASPRPLSFAALLRSHRLAAGLGAAAIVTPGQRACRSSMSIARCRSFVPRMLIR